MNKEEFGDIDRIAKIINESSPKIKGKVKTNGDGCRYCHNAPCECGATQIISKDYLKEAQEQYERAYTKYVDLLKEELGRVNKAKKHLPPSSHIDIIKMRRSGKTFREIGEHFDISAQRVEQIVNRTNIDNL